MNDWVVIYLIGCVFSILIAVVNTLTAWTIRWVTRTNVVLKNLKKVTSPDDTPFIMKAGKTVVLLMMEFLLSWLSVIMGLIQLVRLIFTTLRDALTSTPDSIQKLQFPLRTNPNLSRESVWAYVTAIGAATGDQIRGPGDLLSGLAELQGEYPSFDRIAALRQLATLAIVEPALIDEAIARSMDGAPKSHFYLEEIGYA